MLKRFNLIVIILLFIWISFFPLPLQQQYHLVTKIVLASCFVLVLVRKGKSIFKFGDFPLWFFIFAIGINILFAQEKDISLKTYMNLAIPLFLIYYLVTDAISSESRFNLLAKVICISSILVALGGIFECIFKFNPIYKHFIGNPFYNRYITGFVRPMSTQYNPAVLGSFLLGCMPFNFLLFKKTKSIFRFLGSMSLILSVGVMILTLSRGVFLGLIAMVIFYLFVSKKYLVISIFLIMMLTFVLISSFSMYPFNRFGVDRLITGKDGVISEYRFNRFVMTKRIVEEYPLVGLGFKHIRERFFEYYPKEGNVPYEFRIADNMYLTILAETGIIGFVAYLLFISSIFRKAWTKLNLGLIIVLCSFVGLLVNMAAYELFYWPNQYLFFCILVGLIETFWRHKIPYES